MNIDVVLCARNLSVCMCVRVSVKAIETNCSLADTFASKKIGIFRVYAVHVTSLNILYHLLIKNGKSWHLE